MVASSSSPRRRRLPGLTPRICSSRGGSAWRALRDLDQRRVVEDGRDGPVLALGELLTPADELARDRARGCPRQRVDSRQASEDHVDVARVPRPARAQRHSSSAHARRPLAPQLALQRPGELEQVKHVLARVGELLVVERTAVPARVARGLLHAHADHLAQQRVVAGLRREPGKAGRDLGIEDPA